MGIVKTGGVYQGGSYGKQFAPTDFTDCIVWLDASDASTITLNGTDVASWADKSGNGNDAVQGTAAKQPLYVTDGMNGKGVLRTNGTTDSMAITSVDYSNSQQVEIFLVMDNRTLFTIDDSLVFMESSANYNGNTDSYILNVQRQIALNIDGIVMATAEAAGYHLFCHNDYYQNQDKVFNYIMDKTLPLVTQYDIKVNNSSVTDDDTFTEAQQTGTFGAYDLYLFSRANTSLFCDIDCAEIIIYKKKLTDAERAKVYTYLSAKWGIS